MKRPATYPQNEIWAFIIHVLVGEGEKLALNDIHTSIYDPYTDTCLGDAYQEFTDSGTTFRQYLIYRYQKEPPYAFLLRSLMWVHTFHSEVYNLLDDTQISPDITAFIVANCDNIPHYKEAKKKFNTLWRDIASKKAQETKTKERRKAKREAFKASKKKLEEAFNLPSPQI